ncbi:MAG: hypothetical protein GXP32_06340, partial [Kiritimatiellaeota bacterium]|nr:hypothetical protein [Kiritimatiellota bacterium]
MSEINDLNQASETVAIARGVAVESELGNVAKGGFIASLDHLLRNPMNSVLGMLSLMKD